jgi:proteasome lid subunit RPN8/RPN11
MLPEHQVVEEAPLYVRWSPDRTNYALELKLELVSKIAHELAQAERMGVEVGGVMIGVFLQGDSPTLRIDEIEIIRHNPEDGAIYMLAPGQYERFAQVRQTARNRGKTAVGFFRTHLRPGPLRPSLADRTWLADEFKQPVYAMLLIQAREPHTAAFFLATQGQLSVHPSVREFRFNESEFKGLPEILADAREGRESVSARVIKAGSYPWARVVLIVVIVAAAFWAFFWSVNYWLVPGKGVNLAITGNDHLLEITWNHNARPITHATGAVLQITDGASHKEVRLGPDELKLGSIEYQRATQNVEVSMTLSTPGAAPAMQSAEWPQQTARPSAPPH